VPWPCAATLAFEAKLANCFFFFCFGSQRGCFVPLSHSTLCLGDGSDCFLGGQDVLIFDNAKDGQALASADGAD
jgi:hypothetical protein